MIRVFLNSFYRYFDSDQELENGAFHRFITDKYGDVTGRGIFDDVIWNDDPDAPVTAPQWSAPKKKQSRIESSTAFCRGTGPIDAYLAGKKRARARTGSC